MKEGVKEVLFSEEDIFRTIVGLIHCAAVVVIVVIIDNGTFRTAVHYRTCHSVKIVVEIRIERYSHCVRNTRNRLCYNLFAFVDTIRQTIHEVRHPAFKVCQRTYIRNGKVQITANRIGNI